jgi:hypothetical protein
MATVARASPSVAHEWSTMATLLVLSRDNCYTGGSADERSQKSRSPVTFRSSGFDQAAISLDVIAVNFHSSRQRGSGRRACPPEALLDSSRKKVSGT